MKARVQFCNNPNARGNKRMVPPRLELESDASTGEGARPLHHGTVLLHTHIVLMTCIRSIKLSH